jgi:hypothetical protein
LDGALEFPENPEVFGQHHEADVGLVAQNRRCDHLAAGSHQCSLSRCDLAQVNRAIGLTEQVQDSLANLGLEGGMSRR